MASPPPRVVHPLAGPPRGATRMPEDDVRRPTLRAPRPGAAGETSPSTAAGPPLAGFGAQALEILESITDGFLYLDADWRFRYVNRTAERLLRHPREELLGRCIWHDFEATIGSAFHTHYLQARRTGQAVSFEAESIHRPGTWFEVRAYPSAGGLSVYFHDATARKRAELALRLLAEAGETLASSLDYEVTLASVVRLAVPALADWCFIDVVEEDGRIRRVATAHVDPEHEALTRALLECPPEAGGPNLSARVLRTGRSWLQPDIPDAGLAALSHHPEHLHILRMLGLRSGIAVPLVARDRTFGVLRLATSVSGRRYGPDDLAVAEELARRAALAVDNARLYEATQRAVRERERVLHVVSHDLRNPLAAIVGHADLLRLQAEAAAGSAKTLRWIEMIARAATQMGRLIRDLLDFANIEAGRLALHPAACSAASLLAESVELHRPLAAAKHVRLAGDPVSAAHLVWADRERVLQVFSNLIGNALHFTPPGGRVTLSAEPVEGGLRFAVADTGTGIPADQLPRLFEPYWRGATPRRDGSGLGLAIARAIVEAHGGRLHVESRAGEGSTFYFTLARHHADAATPVDPEARHEAQGTGRRR